MSRAVKYALDRNRDLRAGALPAADHAPEDAIGLLLGVLTAALEKVEIAALVGLHDVLQEHRAVAAPVLRRGGHKVGEASLDLGRGHLEVEAPCGEVEADHV